MSFNFVSEICKGFGQFEIEARVLAKGDHQNHWIGGFWSENVGSGLVTLDLFKMSASSDALLPDGPWWIHEISGRGAQFERRERDEVTCNSVSILLYQAEYRGDLPFFLRMSKQEEEEAMERYFRGGQHPYSYVFGERSRLRLLRAYTKEGGRKFVEKS